MIFSVKTEKKQKHIDIREAYNLWDLLNSKYQSIEIIQMYLNQLHDVDLKMLVKKLHKTVNEHISQLEKQMEVYAVKSPDRNRRAITFPAGSQQITDELISLELFLYLQEHIENLSRVLRSTVTNDSIRSLVKKMTYKTIDDADKIICYLTAKGWLSTPPMYKHIPENVKERLSVAEAANLWDHLTLRYDNIKTTEIFINVVHDLDFKVILNLGLKNLHRQAEVLENELQHFGIPLPKRPSKITLTLSDTEILSDDYMYRILANALQGTAILHAQAYKECVVNDRVRAIFKKLLTDEIEYIDKFLKYGKMTGWLNPVPTYGP